MDEHTAVKKTTLEHFIEIPLERLKKAEWNYKTDDPELTKKLIKNISRNGQIENLIVREIAKGNYEVVNGNHRLDCLQQMNIQSAVCYNLGKVTLQAAQRIAIETNETKFTSSIPKLADILAGLKKVYGSDDLADSLPYTEKELENYSNIANFDWDDWEIEIKVKEQAEGEHLYEVSMETAEAIKALADEDTVTEDARRIKVIQTLSFVLTKEEMQKFAKSFGFKNHERTNEYAKDKFLENFNSRGRATG